MSSGGETLAAVAASWHGWELLAAKIGETLAL
jgi:hypothetical protein